MNRTTSRAKPSSSDVAEIDEDWEEYNPSKGPFHVHMIAGSCAGLAEHGIVYPIDTAKTFYQARYDNGAAGAGKQALKSTIEQHGWRRMYRGIFAVFLGVVPAHSAYFSIYEVAKESFGANESGHHPIAAAASGVCATMAHDIFMTPLDVVKQRLQLGCVCQNTKECYKGVVDCTRGIVRQEGYIALFRSFPTTLLMNVPYSAVNVAVNESARKLISPSGQFDEKTFFLSGAIAGGLAALFTNPLDVAKTRLQTQSISSAPVTSTFEKGVSAASKNTRGLSTSVSPGTFGSPALTRALYTSPKSHLRYSGLFDTMQKVAREEGPEALLRGSLVRMLAHAPAVGVSWTAYELCKKFLINSL